MRLFRILFAFDLLGLLALLYFFLDGLRFPSSGGNSMGVWTPLLLAVVGLLAGAWRLRSKGYAGAANGLLGLLAAPFVLYLLFVGLMVALQPSMR